MNDAVSKFRDDRGRLVMTRVTRRTDVTDRSFDIEFWQSLSDKERFSAAWELVETAHKLKGGDLENLKTALRVIEALPPESETGS